MDTHTREVVSAMRTDNLRRLLTILEREAQTKPDRNELRALLQEVLDERENGALPLRTPTQWA